MCSLVKISRGLVNFSPTGGAKIPRRGAVVLLFPPWCHPLEKYLLLLLIFFPTLTARKSNYLDVVFVVGSKTEEDFEKAKTSIKDMIRAHTLANTNYGVVQYGSSATAVTFLDKFTTLDEFESSVEELSWKAEGEVLDEGIEEGHRMLMKYGRPSARKLLVVFTDKNIKPNVSHLSRSVGSATDDGIQIVSVFFGRPSDPAKVSILSPGDDEPPVISPTDGGKGVGPEVKTKVLRGNGTLILKTCFY